MRRRGPRFCANDLLLVPGPPERFFIPEGAPLNEAGQKLLQTLKEKKPQVKQVITNYAMVHMNNMSAPPGVDYIVFGLCEDGTKEIRTTPVIFSHNNLILTASGSIYKLSGNLAFSKHDNSDDETTTEE